MLTFQQALILNQLAGIIQFPEILRLLSDLLPLQNSILLVVDNVGGSYVELGDQGGESNACALLMHRSF